MPSSEAERGKALAALAVICLAACGSAERGAPDRRYIVTAPGRIDSAEEARSLVASRDAIIARVLVKEGDQIQAGQVLLELECNEEMARLAGAHAEDQMVRKGPRREDVAKARADLEAAGHGLRNLDDKWQRMSPLATKGVVSARDFEAVEIERAVMRALREESQATLDGLESGSREEEKIIASAKVAEAQAIVDKCSLRSPIEGNVLKVYRREGEYSSATQGQPLVAVGNLGNMIVRAEFEDRDAALVTPGRKVDVWMDGDEQRASGIILRAAGIMGRRQTRTLDPADHFDRDSREAIVRMDSPLPAPVIGLRVNVGIRP